MAEPHAIGRGNAVCGAIAQAGPAIEASARMVTTERIMGRYFRKPDMHCNQCHRTLDARSHFVDVAFQHQRWLVAWATIR